MLKKILTTTFNYIFDRFTNFLNTIDQKIQKKNWAHIEISCKKLKYNDKLEICIGFT